MLSALGRLRLGGRRAFASGLPRDCSLFSFNLQQSQPIIKPSVLLHLGSPEMPAMLPPAFMNELPKADPDTHALHEAYHVAEVRLCETDVFRFLSVALCHVCVCV
jgi:hypothetical protein